MTRCSKLQKNYFSFEELPLWKRAVLLSICFLTIISFILPFLYTPQASDVEYISDAEMAEFNEILNGNVKNGGSVLSPFAAQQVAQVLTGFQFTDMVRDWLVMDFSVGNGSFNESTSGGHFGRLYATLSGEFLPLARTIGVGLLLLYFFLALIDRATSDNFTVEVGIKLLLKLVAGYMLMEIILPNESGSSLIVEIFNIFAKITDPDVADMRVTREVYNEVMETLNAGFFAAFAKIVRIGAPAIVRWIMKIACLGTAIGRLLEATLLVVFSPIGVANVFNSSSAGNSSGVRYLKKIAVIAFQGAIISASLYMIEAFIYYNNGWNVFVNLAVMFAGTSFIGKSKSIANEIINP